MKKNIPGLNIRYKLWLESEDETAILGDGKILLLKLIKEHGCLKEAAEKLNWSYRTTWNNLKRIEKKLGFKLTNPVRGGKGGGGILELTPEAVQLIEYYDVVDKKLRKKIEAAISSFEKDYKRI